MYLSEKNDQNNQSDLKMTVLHRKNGLWGDIELVLLRIGLVTEVSTHPSFPQYLILLGHHTIEETLNVINFGPTHTVSQLIGIDNQNLPFKPHS